MEKNINIAKRESKKLWVSIDSIVPDVHLEPEESLSRKIKSLPTMTTKFLNFGLKNEKKISVRTKKTEAKSTKTTLISLKSPNLCFKENLKIKNFPNQCLYIQEKELEENDPSEISNSDSEEESDSYQDLTSFNEEDEAEIHTEELFSLIPFFRTNSSKFQEKEKDFLNYGQNNFLVDRIFPKNSDNDQHEIENCKKIARVQLLKAEISRRKNGGILRFKDEFHNPRLRKRKVSNVSFNKRVIVKKYNPRVKVSFN